MMNRTLRIELSLIACLVAGCQQPAQDASDAPARDVGGAVTVGIHLASETAVAGYMVRNDPDDVIIYVDPKPLVTERDITRAEIHTDSAANRDGVLVTFGPQAAERLKASTANHVDKPLVIMVNNRIISVPFVSNAFGERAVLMGDLSPMTPAELAAALGGPADDEEEHVDP